MPGTRHPGDTGAAQVPLQPIPERRRYQGVTFAEQPVLGALQAAECPAQVAAQQQLKPLSQAVGTGRRAGQQLGMSSVAFINGLNNPDTFANYLNFLGDQGRQELRQLIEDRVEPFMKLNQQTEDLLAEMRKKPQVSLSFQSKARELGRDEFKAGATLDIGLEKQLDFTLNAGLEFLQGTDNLKEDIGETTNLAAKHAVKVKQMDALIQKHLDATKAVVAEIIQTFIITRPQMTNGQRHA